MTAILRLTTLRWGALALILLALFLAATPITAYAQDEGTCADSIDNDGDGFINDGCPAVGEPEATAAPTDEPTAVPTDEPTEVPTGEPTVAPTDEPAPTPTPTAAPEPTIVPVPTELPPTGGPPDNPDEIQFTEAVTQTVLIGALVTFLITLTTVAGLTLTSQVKSIAAFLISLGAAIVFVSMRDNLALKSVNDVVAVVAFVLISSQAGYLLADKLLKAALPKSDAFKKSEAQKE